MISRGTSPGSATVHLVNQLDYGISLDTRVYSSRRTSFDLELGYFLVAPAAALNYSIQGGYGYLLGPRYKLSLGGSALELKLIYQSMSQTTSLTTQLNSSLSFLMGFSFETQK